ncbi:MAG: hypothetical protein G01um101429_1031 [Parcubacteria group bacterium Gr01-1014_29]|nr:MAG: hypothetical protein G01um101429_1031 [Parcubacteria group bacterium Gr01-1014_29]
MAHLTVMQAEELGLEQLYEFLPALELHHSGYGTMEYGLWLEKEEDRINHNPLRRAAVVANAVDLVALFVNPPVIWEREAQSLGYVRFIQRDWSTPCEKLEQQGIIDARPIIRNTFSRARGEEWDDRRVVIVRKDNEPLFAVFSR